MPAEPADMSTQTAGTTTNKTVPPKIASALARYRVSAIVVGWGLLILCLTLVLKYGFDMNWTVKLWGPIHGMLYAIYVFLAFDLAYKDRWTPWGIVKVIVAGVIPGISFVAERDVCRKVRARQRV